MRYLKTNTATKITVGPFLDVTDGITPEVSLTVTGCHLTLMVDNAGTPTLALDADATASGGNNDMAHITNDDAGMYSLELTAAQLNYLGGAILTIIDTDVHLPVFHELTILPANVYDSMIAGSDALQVHANEITNGLITAAAIADGAIDAATFAAGAINAAAIADGAIDAATFAAGAINAAAIAADAIGASELAADAVTEIQSGLATAAALATVAGYIDTEVAAVLAAVDTEVAAILADTGTDGVVVAAASKSGYALTAAEHTSIADALLTRDWASVTGEAARSVLNALRFLRNKVSISGTTMTVTEEDDTTEAWSATVTTDASAEPVTGVDPS
jgi:hypothetical protein